MKLQLFEREAKRKSKAKQLRREGQIPAVVYSKGHANQHIAISESEYLAALRHITKGRLPTTVFTLVDSKGKECKAIVKEVQYHLTTYKVIHLDFEELEEKVPVNVKVPIEFTGTAECVGAKLGGVIRPVIRYLRVRCLPSQIPMFFQLDVRQLEMQQTKRLSDIAIPDKVRPLVDLREVAVVIAKR